MVPPCWASDHPVTNRSQYSCWTLKPRQYTDTIHRCPIGSSGAEGTTLGAVLYDLNQGVWWTAEYTIQASVHPVLKQKSWRVSVEFKCNCSQTLRCWMNRCMYRRFIRRSILNLLAAELIRRVLKLGRRIIRCYKLDFNSSNSAPLSFPSILLLQPCFHELSEKDSNQGTWVCIFYGFWSAWSSY
jgi:hypothetical protein